MVLERKFVGNDTGLWNDLFRVITLNKGKYVEREDYDAKIDLSYTINPSSVFPNSSSTTSVHRSIFSWNNATLFYELVQAWHYDDRNNPLNRLKYSDEVYISLFGDEFVESKQGRALVKAIDTLIAKHKNP